MISRALDREMDEFVTLLETHLARLIHAGQARTKRMSRSEHENLLQDALIVAWRRREYLDPLNEPMSAWFERCLNVARTETIEPDLDELFLLSKLSPAPQDTSGPRKVPRAPGTEAASDSSDATVKLGKECPPCWRCRYFDGWLPKRWPYGENWRPKDELDAVCFEIDKRKVAIAKYVQGAYAPELLED